MSTKTNFKRIALVAVAALGLGVLSSVPSQAVISNLAVSTTAGAAGQTGAKSDSTTGGLVTITGMALTASTDTYSVTIINKSRPALATAQPALLLMLQDTATSTTASSVRAVTPVVIANNMNLTTESATSVVVTAGSGAGYMNSKFKAFMESTTGSGAADRVAGDYVYTIVVTPFSATASAGVTGTAVTADITITIAALASQSTTVSAANSTAFIGTSTGATSDAVVSALATASDTPRGYITVKLRNAENGSAARESVTITTTIGQVGTSTNRGRSVVLAYTGDTDYNIYSDGTAGTGTITVSTPSVTFSTKTVSFYAAAAKTLTATVAHPKLKVGANSGAVRVTAVDATGVNWAGTAYIYASSAADALVAGSVTPSACSWNATFQRHDCDVTATTAGTAKFKIIDAATVAAATATSNEITVTVNTAAVAKVALSFDKATYAPNERMRIYVTPQDATGATLPASTFANLLASGGITSNASFTGASVDLSGVSITTAAADSSATAAKAGSLVYTVYAPANGGTVTISATGGTSLPAAGQVAVTASATVTDSGAAALAAVNALATTVASLKTLITTLTNLVLKIQKKVKA